MPYQRRFSNPSLAPIGRVIKRVFGIKDETAPFEIPYTEAAPVSTGMPPPELTTSQFLSRELPPGTPFGEDTLRSVLTARAQLPAKQMAETGRNTRAEQVDKRTRELQAARLENTIKALEMKGVQAEDLEELRAMHREALAGTVGAERMEQLERGYELRGEEAGREREFKKTEGTLNRSARENMARIRAETRGEQLDPLWKMAVQINNANAQLPQNAGWSTEDKTRDLYETFARLSNQRPGLMRGPPPRQFLTPVPAEEPTTGVLPPRPITAAEEERGTPDVSRPEIEGLGPRPEPVPRMGTQVKPGKATTIEASLPPPALRDRMVAGILAKGVNHPASQQLITKYPGLLKLLEVSGGTVER